MRLGLPLNNGNPELDSAHDAEYCVVSQRGVVNCVLKFYWGDYEALVSKAIEAKFVRSFKR